MALQDWLTKKIFPFEDKLYPQKPYTGATMLAMAESLKFGIVSTQRHVLLLRRHGAEPLADSGAKDNISQV